MKKRDLTNLKFEYLDKKKSNMSTTNAKFATDWNPLNVKKKIIKLFADFGQGRSKV